MTNNPIMINDMPPEILISEEERMTLVIESYRKKRRNHRLLFGVVDLSIRRTWHRRMLGFRPGRVFGYERWMANIYGTQRWSIVVCRATTDMRFARLPGVLPGAEVWLEARGQTQVTRVFAALDAMKAADISPEHLHERRWRALHNALEIHREPADLVKGWSC